MKPRSYDEAGVSVARGDSFAARLARLDSPAVGAIGGFAGGLEIDIARYRHPVLLSTTDGVGTKLLVARELGVWNTVGVDLVAMCVNDLAVCGADPAVFLDYIACGRIDEDILSQVASGIVTGCELAECTLAGGETAELPDMYGPGDIDLAGFATGIAERDEQLPRRDAMIAGDLVVGLASSGIHSNGLSLARKVLPADDRDGWRELLTPTRIYVRELRAARPHIKGAAHITGGGLVANLRRILPDGLQPEVGWDWQSPQIFDRIADAGPISAPEMRRVFNMGVGIAMVVSPRERPALERALDESLITLGSLVNG
ncbi:MAG: phosphoribosylformylglycinamidine cyclo-ligase [Spirochaetota bacterium]